MATRQPPTLRHARFGEGWLEKYRGERKLAGYLLYEGEAQGRLYALEELARHFSHALFPRVTNRHGCVTLHSYHFYVEEGLPTTQVLLWVSGEQLRAVFENVVLAAYHCRYDWRDRNVKDVRQGVLYPTRFGSPQGTLIPLTPQDAVVVSRPHPPKRRRPHRVPARPLVLFERGHTGG